MTEKVKAIDTVSQNRKDNRIEQLTLRLVVRFFQITILHQVKELLNLKVLINPLERQFKKFNVIQFNQIQESLTYCLKL